MSRREVRHIVATAIVRGPVEREQFRELWAAICLMIGIVAGPLWIAALLLRWIWRVIRLMAMPVSMWILTTYYRRKRVRQIRRNRGAREEWKAKRREMRERIHQFGPGECARENGEGND